MLKVLLIMMGSESILKYVSGSEWKYDLEILREEILPKYIYSAHTLRTYT